MVSPSPKLELRSTATEISKSKISQITEEEKIANPYQHLKIETGMHARFIFEDQDIGKNIPFLKWFKFEHFNQAISIVIDEKHFSQDWVERFQSSSTKQHFNQHFSINIFPPKHEAHFNFKVNCFKFEPEIPPKRAAHSFKFTKKLIKIPKSFWAFLKSFTNWSARPFTNDWTLE